MNAEILERALLLNDLTVTLFDWMAEAVTNGRNLVATNRDGVEVWRATPPDREDCFTALLWDGIRLTAHTWSCYRVAIDADSGEVTILEFTK